MVPGPEVLFLVEIAASEASFEGEGCLSMLGFSCPERETNSNAIYLYGVFFSHCCVGQA